MTEDRRVFWPEDFDAHVPGADEVAAEVAAAGPFENAERLDEARRLVELLDTDPLAWFEAMRASIAASAATHDVAQDPQVARMRRVFTRVETKEANAQGDVIFRQREMERAAADRKLRIVDAEEFLYGDADDPEPLWGDADSTGWAEGESLMVFGPPGVGKSTLAHLLMLGRLGLVSEVLGMPVRDDGGNVLYIAADRPKQIQRAMRRLATHDRRHLLKGRLVVHYGPLPVEVTVDKNWLADLAVEHGATTIVVDSVKDLCQDPSDGLLANGYNLARQEALARGVEWLELHHNRKGTDGNKVPNKLDDVYGNRWLTAGAGSVVCVWGEAGDRIVDLTQLKTPAGMILPTKVEIGFTAGTMTLAGRSDGAPTHRDALRRGPADGMTVGAVAAALNRKEASIRVSMDRDVKDGLLEKYKHPVLLSNLYRFIVTPEPKPTPESSDALFDINPDVNR